MQASSQVQRPSQRRPGSTETGPPLTGHMQAVNPQSTSNTPRTSSGSARSQAARSVNQLDKQISQIEKSVTHLLVATKQLLETLTQWSRGQAREEEVSDVYVRLGYEFNLACRAFNSIGVETTDLGPVPDLLRSILEDTLSQPASHQSLDNFLPRIRDIIINLLHGLKRKQAKLRNRPNKDGSTSRTNPPARQTSGASLGSNETGLTQMLENIPSQAQDNRAQSKYGNTSPTNEQDDMSSLPARTSSAAALVENSASTNRHSFRRNINAPMMRSDSSSSISNTTMQNIPILPPYSNPDHSQLRPESAYPQGPPPPAKQDALSALQRGGDLERRASRRFSAYQIQKHLGASPNGVPVLPPTQNSPIPNRGRDIRESMTAVRSRTSYQEARRKSNRVVDKSPSRLATVITPQRISEEREEAEIQDIPQLVPPQEEPVTDSPIAKTPEELYKPPSPGRFQDKASIVRGTLNGPPPVVPADTAPLPEPEVRPAPSEHHGFIQPKATEEIARPARSARAHTTPPQSQLFGLEDSPPSGKELTLFLQYKSKIKKFVLSEGNNELTIARLQLAFIEKFAWNTHNNGVDLPEIYIQDPISGIRHELEDLADVKDRSVLVLNVEVLDEVKKHFDDGLGNIRMLLEGVRGVVDDQGAMMQRFSDRQLEVSKEMARISTAPTLAFPRTPLAATGQKAGPASAESISEVQSLRKDLAVLRQTYSNLSSEFDAFLNNIKAKGANVKALVAATATPSYEGNAGRAHVNQGKKTLSHDSEALVNRVDDLSDVVEDLRKDVVNRGVRPLPRQLETISKDISNTVKELTKMKDFLRREKPIWTKIWEQELNLVCTERDELTQQEELMADLHGDLDELTSVFKLVEEATRQQNLQNGIPHGGLRSTSRNLPIDPTADPHTAKDGVLGEVRALQPNHENRLEAIERAEKARQRELESRKDGPFTLEVASFVEEGKLKKTGGADEVERLRKVKDERARKGNWEQMQRRRAEMKAREAGEAEQAAAAATPIPASDNSQEGEAAFEDAAEHRSQDGAVNAVPQMEAEGPGQDIDKPASSGSPRQSSWLPAMFSSKSST